MKGFAFNYITIVLSMLLFSGCSVTTVTPYNQQLVDRTESLYKEVAKVIDKGVSSSPRTNNEREAIEKPSEHLGHYSKFEGDYNKLITDTEALILRAMSQSGEISKVAKKLQIKLETVIETSVPSVCKQSAIEIEEISLTAKNYIDLKCIITNWKVQHADKKVTKGTKILKKVNWEARKKIIFNAILAIQQAESFKQ